MNLLFDTHVFLWWHSQRDMLSEHVRRLIEDRKNAVYLSSASVWEIQIKSQAGKLRLSTPLLKIVEQERNENGFRLLPVTLPHVIGLDRLPALHKDPFDRILIAQALTEKLALMSKDAEVSRYPVSVIW